MPDLPTLLADLEGANPAAQARAAESLARLRESNQPALVALARQSGHPHESVAQWCNSALEDAGAPASGQIGELTGLVADQNETVAWWAATLLGRCGSQAAVASPALKAQLARLPDESPLADRIAWALKKIDG